MHIDTVEPTRISFTPSLVLRRAVAILAGALLVALGAQVAVPLPGSPVPLTLQVPAVLIVGGLLGPRLGAASLVLYLGMGAAGFPVFAPVGPPGFARLFGPTGGYLLAYPLAAAIAGHFADRRSWTRLAIGMVGATLLIHLAGVAQLAVLGGDLGQAIRLGSFPFLIGDAVKVVCAGLIVRRFGRGGRWKAMEGDGGRGQPFRHIPPDDATPPHPAPDDGGR